MSKNRCRGRADDSVWSANQIISCVEGTIIDAFAGTQLLATSHADEVAMCRTVGLSVGSAAMKTCIRNYKMGKAKCRRR